jgi:hypothetical protein
MDTLNNQQKTIKEGDLVLVKKRDGSNSFPGREGFGLVSKVFPRDKFGDTYCQVVWQNKAKYTLPESLLEKQL